MRRTRAMSAFAPPPNMPASAGKSPRRWARRWRPEARHERSRLADWVAGCGSPGWRAALASGGADLRNSTIRAARTGPGGGDAGRRWQSAVEFAAGDAAHHLRGLFAGG